MDLRRVLNTGLVAGILMVSGLSYGEDFVPIFIIEKFSARTVKNIAEGNDRPLFNKEGRCYDEETLITFGRNDFEDVRSSPISLSVDWPENWPRHKMPIPSRLLKLGKKINEEKSKLLKDLEESFNRLYEEHKRRYPDASVQLSGFLEYTLPSCQNITAIVKAYKRKGNAVQELKDGSLLVRIETGGSKGAFPELLSLIYAGDRLLHATQQKSIDLENGVDAMREIFGDQATDEFLVLGRKPHALKVARGEEE